MNILDSNGQPADPDAPRRAIDIPEVQAFVDKMDADQAEAKALAEADNVVPLPPQEPERTATIAVHGNRRAIKLLFETFLDGPRVNLLLARIYVAAENAEREVNRLEIKEVERILQKFKDSRPPAADGETR